MYYYTLNNEKYLHAIGANLVTWRSQICTFA